MEITTDKVLKIDETTEIDSPVLTVEEMRINLVSNLVTPLIRFTSGKTVAIRNIEPMEYKPSWTIEDLEAYILKWITANEVKK